MKLLKTIGVTTATVAGVLMLSAWTPLGHQKAKSLYQVDSIQIEASQCEAAFDRELTKRGFAVTDSKRSSDATLQVSMREARNPEFGKDGRYTAELIGAGGKVLFTYTGHENSLTHNELCADISDDVVDRLQDRMG